MNNELIFSEERGEIVLYQPNEKVRLEVRLQDETVWLTQQQMAELFMTTKQNVSLHINNIFREAELERTSVVKESLTAAADGKKYRTKFYNLDVIISVGYRVKSSIGTRFRQWALAVLKDYLLRGYAVHQQTMALQQINLRIDAQNDRLARIEDTIDRQQLQLDFVVRANEKPEEVLIPSGCVWDAYAFVCDLIRSAERRIVLVDNYVDERVLTMLDKRNTGVEAAVHTRYTEHVKLDFEKHNKQNTPTKFCAVATCCSRSLPNRGRGCVVTWHIGERHGPKFVHCHQSWVYRRSGAGHGGSLTHSREMIFILIQGRCCFPFFR